MENIILPEKLGHGYILPILLNIEDIYKEPLCSHRRFRVFASKGLKCEYCSKIGIYLIRAQKAVRWKKEHKKKVFASEYHIDIYTADFELMTIDHIVPKCKGGNNDISNLIPCCNTCNGEKGGKDYFAFKNRWKKYEEQTYGLLISNSTKKWKQDGG